MTELGPFGIRCDMACAVVPPDPTRLVVAGCLSVDYHRDAWLSLDTGETFSQIELPNMLRPCCTLVQKPPGLLVAARGDKHGHLVFWELNISPDSSPPVASLELLDSEQQDMIFELGGQTLRPPRISIDLEL